MVSTRRLQKAREEHRKALDGYSHSALAVPFPLWSTPRQDGGWSPAEVTEHLILGCDAVYRELAGGPGMAPRVGPVGASFLRWFLLPHILFHRTLPKSSAPRETRPESVPGSPEAAIERLRNAAGRFEEAALDPSRVDVRSLSHPYFGRVTPFQLLRLSAVHIEHHRRQLDAIRTQTPQ